MSESPDLGHRKVSVVGIKWVNFRENIWAFHRVKQDCQLYIYIYMGAVHAQIYTAYCRVPFCQNLFLKKANQLSKVSYKIM